MAREVKRKTLKWKKEQAEAEKKKKVEAQNGHFCQWDQTKIDRATCTVRQIRDTGNKCLGCKHYGG